MARTSEMSVLHDRVLSVYLGLTASGYDMADTSNPVVESLVSSTRTKLHDPAISYFAQAKRETCAVNPYWPRASLLLLACTYIDDDTCKYREWEDVAVRLRSMENVDPAELGEDTVDWIARLPEALERVQHHPACGELRGALAAFARADAQVAQAAADTSRSRAAAAFGIPLKDLPGVEVLLNPLQSPYVADFLDYEGTLCVVTAAPRPDSILHELLHRVLGPKVAARRDMIAAHSHLLEPVFEAMQSMQYAWSLDEASWLRVFEESIVRAASIWVAYRHDPAYTQMLAEAAGKAGFSYVPALVRQLLQEPPRMASFGDFLLACLSRCEVESTGA